MSQNAKTGCRGNMIWFDHAIWFMLNNLDRIFYSKYPSITAKYGAFLTWTNTVGLVVVCMHITFMAYRKLMETTAVELAANPTNKLQTKYVETSGTRQVERLFKLDNFSLESTLSPSSAPLSRKRRINMNVTPEDAFHHNQAGQTCQRGPD
jgi:hypothetical protein